MAVADFDLLTESEKQCLRLVLVRNGSKDIAPLVGLTHHTVDKRLKSAMRKLGATRRFDAARMLAEHESASVTGASYQSSDGPDQAPDIGEVYDFPMLGASADDAFDHRGSPGMFREEQASFFVRHRLDRSALELPIRGPGGQGNRLGTWKRIGWIVGLTFLLVLVFGFLATSLASLGRMATFVAHSARQQ